VNVQPGQRHLPQHKALPGRGPGVAGQGYPLGHPPGTDSGERDELSKIDDFDTEMDRLEDLRAALLCVESPFSGHYVFVGDVDPNVVDDHGLSYGSKETAARRRLDFYRQAGLRVKVGQETEISLDVGGTSVRKSACASGSTRSPTGTP
jgi:hypothetical protein